MRINRRRLFAALAGAAGTTVAVPAAGRGSEPSGRSAMDAASFGLRANSADDQSVTPTFVRSRNGDRFRLQG